MLQTKNAKSRIKELQFSKKRKIYKSIDWNRSFILLWGERGVGKTTLMLQRMGELEKEGKKFLYVSFDSINSFRENINEEIKEFCEADGRYLFLDEIHYFTGIGKLIKGLNDNYEDIKIVMSCVSSIDTLRDYFTGLKVDSFHICGQSFREFLEVTNQGSYNACSLEELVDGHEEGARGLSEEVDIYTNFIEYLKRGYYPYFEKKEIEFNGFVENKLKECLGLDYQIIENANLSTTQKSKQMLNALAKAAPKMPNMSKLYEKLSTDRNLGMKILLALERLQIVNLLYDKRSKAAKTAKPTRLLYKNPNIASIISDNDGYEIKGESFFVNQLEASGHKLFFLSTGSYLVDNKYLFTLCRGNEERPDLKDIKDSYMVVFDAEIGSDNQIPLWMFGMLY